jgi:formate dehydrogenase iron-sulfur subunit
MKIYAEKRAGELRERGHKDAGVYDPKGVGGTHVMYVLKHADRPELVGLPKDPSVSTMVNLWKGVTKPIATALMGAAAFAGFLHYVMVGPKEVEEDSERKSDKEQA